MKKIKNIFLKTFFVFTILFFYLLASEPNINVAKNNLKVFAEENYNRYLFLELDYDLAETRKLYKGETFTIQTLLSKDIGVMFLVAGDDSLNQLEIKIFDEKNHQVKIFNAETFNKWVKKDEIDNTVTVHYKKSLSSVFFIPRKTQTYSISITLKESSFDFSWISVVSGYAEASSY